MTTNHTDIIDSNINNMSGGFQVLPPPYIVPSRILMVGVNGFLPPWAIPYAVVSQSGPPNPNESANYICTLSQAQIAEIQKMVRENFEADLNNSVRPHREINIVFYIFNGQCSSETVKTLIEVTNKTYKDELKRKHYESITTAAAMPQKTNLILQGLRVKESAQYANTNPSVSNEIIQQNINRNDTLLKTAAADLARKPIILYTDIFKKYINAKNLYNTILFTSSDYSKYKLIPYNGVPPSSFINNLFTKKFDILPTYTV